MRALIAPVHPVHMEKFHGLEMRTAVGALAQYSCHMVVDYAGRVRQMRRILIRAIVTLAAAAIGIFAILLVINIMLFFKLKSMYH